ncbi:MAG TPA: ABC transporter permease [Gaiellaceae bacterium]|nr:ABC transporter permease [Gaiellaceae bacterium]
MRVARFLIRRLVTGLFTLCALLALTFVVYWALPSQPSRFVYPYAQQLSNYQVAHANHLLGLDRSKPVQYVDYLRQLAHGDVGRFWTGSQLVDNKKLEQTPIGPTLFPSLRITLSIIFGGAVLVVLLALPLGTLAGRRIGSVEDRAISGFTLVGICTHPMVLGLILASTFGTIGLGWLPSDGYCPLFRGPTDQCGGAGAWSEHLILPWLTFALLFLALYTRMVRISIAETLHEDYVRTARAKGLPERRVLQSHVLPSASLRVLTMVGMEIGTAIGVCIYVEAAFRFNGLGRQAVIAMGGASFGIDLPFTLAIVFLISVIVIVGNLAVDVLYAVLDPRAGRETARGREKPLVGGVF